MSGRSGIDELLRRHREFWECRGDPLVADLEHPDWRPRPYPLRLREPAVDPVEIGPSDMDPEALLGSDAPPEALRVGDMLRPVRTIFPVSWMASLLGCPIFASAYSCSARPSSAPIELDRILSSPWLEVMDRVLELAVLRAGTERPVGQLHLRGIIDMLAAYLGEVRLCTALYDEPEEIDRLAGIFTELHTTLVRRGLDARPAWYGGTVSTWGVYAPGELIDYQIDASSILSPGMYQKRIAGFDRTCLEHVPYRLVHLHACGLHMLDLVLAWPRPLCVEVTLERETGVWRPQLIVEVCRRAHRAGACVLLHGELSREERSWLLDQVPAEGLAVFSWLPRPTTAAKG